MMYGHEKSRSAIDPAQNISATIVVDVKRFCRQIKTDEVFGTHACVTGSIPVANTIGTVVVTALAASAELLFPTITATRWG